MKLTVIVKQLGRKKPLLGEIIIDIADIGISPTLEELISAVVSAQVAAYNSKISGQNLLPILTSLQMEEKARAGKIGFGAIHNENKIDLNKAIENAWQSFEDGIFAVFAGDEQITRLHQKVLLDDNPQLTFIRLTFLAGSIW